MTSDPQDFLAAQGLAAVPRIPLVGDASGRCYHRLAPGPGWPSLLLMDTPQPEQDIVRFTAVAELLLSLGLSAPQVHAANPDQGFALLEDFGDATFSRLLAQGTPPLPLYLLATDALIALHQRFQGCALALPRYDAARFLEQTLLLADHGLPEALGRSLLGQERQALEAAVAAVSPAALALPESLLLRDFHVDNLIHLPDRPGAAACGLLDFQDAGVGPVLYDLVSLLEDARRDVPVECVVACRSRYLAAFPHFDTETVSAAWAVLAALRHGRIVAVFHRLAGQGRTHYLDFLPRVLRLLGQALAHPATAPLRAPLAPLFADSWAVRGWS